MFTQAAWTAKSNVWLYAAVALGLAALWQIWSLFYNLYFHPLRRYPGPLIHRASSLPWAFQHCLGWQAFYTSDLHDRYGPVVRIGPNHLSFTDARAWKDIYGHRVGGESKMKEMSKAVTFNKTIRNIPTSIINADREEHSRFRRALSHGFSDSSMRQQEPMIQKYVDLLLQRLHQEIGKGNSVFNMEAWYNWTTFDVVGDLVFGQSFHCLENIEYHPWIASIFRAIKFGSWMVALSYIGFHELVQVLFACAQFAIGQARRVTEKMVSDRLAFDKPRDDLFEGLVKKREEWGLSFQKLSSNAFILVLAGSETTATTLSGATYLLLEHPEALEKLKQEVRSTFNNSDEITINTVNHLSYMLAVLNEALRMYPPVTSALVRNVPPEGASIAGHFVHGGTYVEVQHWSMNHSKDNWADPWVFRPERFLASNEEALKAGNKLESLQAFNVGPRNCIGRNLAYAEMRLILARIIFDFDLELADDSKNWIEKQKSYALWDRIPLNVHLTPVKHRTVV
ncbi:putative cytochrome P450 [Xylariomycetidae sp. FL0641]|nr:putative cytochrome P450 [Xylariomycetidae sp. FL0641]